MDPLRQPQPPGFLPTRDAVICSLGILGSGQEIVLTVVVRANHVGSLLTSASVQSTESDVEDANNQASLETLIRPRPPANLVPVWDHLNQVCTVVRRQNRCRVTQGP